MEHIIPKAIFKGNIHHLFKSRAICKECNNTNGILIDGAFLRDPFICIIRSHSSLQYMFSKIIDNNRIDLYFYKNTYLYVISELFEKYKTFVGGIPTRKGYNLVFIEINKNFDMADFQNYFENIAKLINNGLSTKNIYFKTSVNIDLNVDYQPATEEQKTQYFARHGIQNFVSLKHEKQELVKQIFKILESEISDYGHYKMNFSADITAYTKELAKISFLLGHNLFGNSYISSYCGQIHLSTLQNNFSPFQNIFVDDLTSPQINNIKNGIKPYFEHQNFPVIIIFTYIINLELRIFLFYGNKFMIKGFCSLITQASNFIQSFHNEHRHGIFLIKHYEKNGFDTFSSFEELMATLISQKMD